jgi:hypothetical protein
MKKTFLVALALFLLLSMNEIFGQAFISNAQQHKEYFLFAEGKSDYCIAIDKDASESEQFAAKELQHWVKECAAGGHGIDLETCSRSIPLWRTDGTIEPCVKKNYNQAALQNQVMTAGLNRYVPFNTSGQVGATPYQFRSGFNGGIILLDEIGQSDYSRDLFKSAIMERKRIRKYYFGNFYPLPTVSLDTTAWCVTQYHRTNENDGMIMAFRRPQS